MYDLSTRKTTILENLLPSLPDYQEWTYCKGMIAKDKHETMTIWVHLQTYQIGSDLLTSCLMSSKLSKNGVILDWTIHIVKPVFNLAGELVSKVLVEFKDS